MNSIRVAKAVTAVCIIILMTIAGNASDDVHRFGKFLGTEWYGIYMQGSKIGYASVDLRSVNQPVDGWRMETDMVMIFNMMGRVDTMTTSDTRVFESPGSEMYSSKMVVIGGTGEIRVEGKKEADDYIITANVGGQQAKKVLDYPADYLDSLVYIRNYISSGKASVGDSLAFSTFEPTPPLTGKIHQVVKFNSKDEYFFNGVPTDVYNTSWYMVEAGMAVENVMDMDGDELEISLGGGIVMKLEPENTAKALDVTYDLLSDNLIHPEVTIEDPRKLKSLKLRITGINESELLKSLRQTVISEAPDTLMVSIKYPKVPEKILALPIQSARLDPFLKPDPYIQSDDPEIATLAKEITADEVNSWEAAKKINAWVYENINKEFTPDISNALQTLHSRQGDCGEHSVLAVALMRAAGIPSRPVTGLVYWPPGNGFGYHAWIEVYVGDWVMMDPSWGENLINPAHIAMTAGGLLDQISVLSKVIGKVGIEVLEAK